MSSEARRKSGGLLNVDFQRSFTWMTFERVWRSRRAVSG